MFVLPVSGVPVTFRTPDGRDEMVLAEGGPHPVRLRVEAVRMLVPPADSGVGWDDLPYADVDAALLAFRQQMYGDRIVAEIRCGGCGIWSDTAISVAEYLNARRPRGGSDVSSDDDGWWTWRDVRFRPPTVAAVLEAVNAAGCSQDAADQLMRFCCQTTARATLSRVNRLLERLAPALATPVSGRCPHCGEAVTGWFDPGLFVLTELQDRAAVVVDHVHLLAQAYGWNEGEILALPVTRRAAYASRVAGEQLQ